MSLVNLGPEVMHEAALVAGVCVQPILQRLVDTDTGTSRVIPIRCGSTQEKDCPPCADRNRRLRMQQCREGWHLTEDPLPDPALDTDCNDTAAESDSADGGPGVADDDVHGREQAPDADDDAWATTNDAGDSTRRRVRSTRRRSDVADLPHPDMQHRTVGEAFVGNGGRTYHPSMFLTATLDSYGPVSTDGTPVDPEAYDYRRAALDSMHFPKLVDRFWQNLRRSVGYKVQYFACIEPQKRLAPHLHAAVRGVFPRKVFRQVVAATYHQLWWPQCETPEFTGTLPALWDHDSHGWVFPDRQPVTTADARLPVYDNDQNGYVDPASGTPLPTWDQALDQVDDDPHAEPAHVLRFGAETDCQGVIGGSRLADRRVGYLTKYLTKSIAETYGDPEQASPTQLRHINRLHEETRWLPCSPRCANWLRFGVQPKDAEPDMTPGECGHKAHQRDNLGCGGRRVLVSQYWTGKTLSEHRADRAAVVREVLAEAGVEVPETDRCSATTAVNADGEPRYRWEPLNPTATDPPTYRHAILTAITEAHRWRAEYDRAKEHIQSQTHGHSATDPPVRTVTVKSDSTGGSHDGPA